MAKILIIDDNPQVLRLMQTFLEEENHEITVSANGKEGIKLLNASRFDLVITDIIMPEQDGYELLMWLKHLPAKPKVIAISGGAPSLELGTILKVAVHMADKVLSKPVTREVFTKAVAEILAG